MGLPTYRVNLLALTRRPAGFPLQIYSFDMSASLERASAALARQHELKLRQLSNQKALEAAVAEKKKMQVSSCQPSLGYKSSGDTK